MSEPTFGELLQTLRQRKRISQSRLAEWTGHDHSSISRLEAGTRVPSREMVESLAHALELDAPDRAELLAAAGFHDMSIPPALVRALAQLTAEGRPFVVLPLTALTESVYGYPDGGRPR